MTSIVLPWIEYYWGILVWTWFSYLMRFDLHSLRLDFWQGEVLDTNVEVTYLCHSRNWLSYPRWLTVSYTDSKQVFWVADSRFMIFFHSQYWPFLWRVASCMSRRLQGSWGKKCSTWILLSLRGNVGFWRMDRHTWYARISWGLCVRLTAFIFVKFINLDYQKYEQQNSPINIDQGEICTLAYWRAFTPLTFWSI